MDCIELSDLEEGEILEYESLSPCCCRSDGLGNKERAFDSLKKEQKIWPFDLNKSKGDDLYLSEQRKEGYLNRSLKNKLSFSKALVGTNSNAGLVDLESVSSEGEFKSDEESKYFGHENIDYSWNNKEINKKGKHSTKFYGAVEDIMSEIGETICRKSRCNYKKRKSKDSQYTYKPKDNSYDLWSRKIFSSHLKTKKHKRKISFSDSDSELKDRSEKRKKRIKRREVHYEKNERETKKSQVKDFDEMRRNLLEKLKKQKVEEESKLSINESASNFENSEIQEVDMLIECTNYVDNPPNEGPGVSDNEEWRTEEKNGEDELDLIKLRLIALASNKNKDLKQTLKTENLEKVMEKENYSNSSREKVDLDRNELLLRAEALKTALLKKHEKRLNKMKLQKPNEIESSSDNVVVSFTSSPVGKNEEERDKERNVENLDIGMCKGNLEEGESGISGISSAPSAHISDTKVIINDTNESDISSASPKKIHSRAKGKRKKRKSGSFASNLKENSEKSESWEEDDRTLRSQLLSDLMKKKSLKSMEKKAVLMDSLQASANRNPTSVKCTLPPKERMKPPLVVKNNLLKKVNVSKKAKPISAPPVPKHEIQRIIIHLGSEDSSDEDASPQDPQGLVDQPSRLGENEKEVTETCLTKSSEVNKKEDEVIQASYEKSVELLLNQAREKIEVKKRIDTETTLTTPEAVYKHLPLSQRLEYIRLKQKIAERERLKNKKKENCGKSFFVSGVDPQPPEISTANEKESVKSISDTSTSKLESLSDIHPKQTNSPAKNSSVGKINSCLSKLEKVPYSPSNGSLNGLTSKGTNLHSANNQIRNKFAEICEKDMKEAQPGNGKKAAAPSEHNTLLLPFSQTLLTKLKLLLKKIKIEKMIEENYEKEISKLKNQLSLFEKKKTEQRFKIKKLGEESIKTYKAIQGATAKSNEKAFPKKEEWKVKKVDEVEGKSEDAENKLKESTVAEGEKKKEEGMKVEEEPDVQISKVNKAPSRIIKELNKDDKKSETLGSGKSSSVGLLDYQSPLQTFNELSNYQEKVDPNVMMCQFDLMGVCKDEECAYQHLRILTKC